MKIPSIWRWRDFMVSLCAVLIWFCSQKDRITSYGLFPSTETDSDSDSDSDYAQLFPLVRIGFWIPFPQYLYSTRIHVSLRVRIRVWVQRWKCAIKPRLLN